MLGMSARELASRTKSLGEEVPQSVITNLETGRREGLSIAELTLLSVALKTAPLELLFPSTDAGKLIEWLPGRHSTNYETREGFAGLDGDPADHTGTYLLIRSLIGGEQETVRLVAEVVADRKANINPEVFPLMLKLICGHASLSKSSRRILAAEGFSLPAPSATIVDLYRLPDDLDLAQRHLEVLVSAWAEQP